MKHFLDSKGNLFALEADGSQDFLIKADFVPATTAQIQAIQNPKLSSEEQAKIDLNLEEQKSGSLRILRELLISLAEQSNMTTNQNYLSLKDSDTKIANLRKQL